MSEVSNGSPTPWAPAPKRERRRMSFKASAGGVAALLFIGTFLFLVIPLAVLEDVRTVWDRYWLDHHGLPATARVVGHHTDYSDSEDGTFYVDASYGSTTTTLEVASEDHAIGSQIQVRVDPADPTHAIATEDPPVPVGLGAFYVFLAVLALGATVTGRIRKRWATTEANLGDIPSGHGERALREP